MAKPTAWAGGLFSVAAAVALLPLLLIEAWWVRRTTPRFPEAPGPACGVVSGSGGVLRIAVLGESPVAGVGLPDHEKGLAARCAAHLQQFIPLSISWRAIGKTGLTARQAVDELIPMLERQPVDLLVIVLGVNDTISLHSSMRFRRDMKELLAAAAKASRGAPAVVCGIPPVKYFPALLQSLRWYLGLRAECLDAVLPSLVESFENLRYVPTKFEAGSDVFAEDGFHPGPLGFDIWAQRLVPAVLEILTGENTL